MAVKCLCVDESVPHNALNGTRDWGKGSRTTGRLCQLLVLSDFLNARTGGFFFYWFKREMQVEGVTCILLFPSVTEAKSLISVVMSSFRTFKSRHWKATRRKRDSFIYSVDDAHQYGHTNEV